MIDPKEVIQKYSPEEICAGAEVYYASHSDPALHIQKPLRSFSETSENFEKLGILLRSMWLGRNMKVLDFGSGTCWISAYLQQLGCRVTSLDPSSTALEIGKQLVATNPFIEKDSAQYKVFNGRSIDDPDETYDRILCYDVLHHIPNWEELLKEMARVLKPGGIIGFKEPGHRHAMSASSQAEMRNYVVLENDIHLDEISEVADSAGLSFMGWSPYIDRPLTIEEYKVAKNQPEWSLGAHYLKKRLFRNLKSNLQGNSIFHLGKGKPVIDSRLGAKLEATIEPESDHFKSLAGEVSGLAVRLTNTGEALWLDKAVENVGKVMCGAHLYAESGERIALDWARSEIPFPMEEGKSCSITLKGPPLGVGEYFVDFDLVSEHVCWFEFATHGQSHSKRVRLSVGQS